jgi:hypothetical protein
MGLAYLILQPGNAWATPRSTFLEMVMERLLGGRACGRNSATLLLRIREGVRPAHRSSRRQGMHRYRRLVD